MADYGQADQGPNEQYRNPALHDGYVYEANDAYTGKARRRYRYHDRGDGMYMAARQLGERPHLVLSGKHAGRSNVKYVGTYARGWDYHLWARDFFTSIANVRFIYLCLWMLLAYTISYFFWAIVWLIVDSSSSGSSPDDDGCVVGLDRNNILSAYIFSLETQATIGFGTRSVGVCWSSAILLTLQNVSGMVLDAVCLGIVFAKLSHPKHRGRAVFISECATIARRDGQLKFMCRIADVRRHTACDAQVRAFLFTWGDGRRTLEGEHVPFRVEAMDLVQGVESMLLLPYVLEHVIDERSPLHGLSHDDLVARSAEVVITYEAVSDFGDSFMVRQSYLASEIHWGCLFRPITEKAPPGTLQHVVDLSRFHDVMMQADLPQLPPGEMSRQVLAAGLSQQPRTLPYPALGENTLVVSDACVLTARNGARQLMFRVGDTRPGQMVEAHVRAYLYEWSGQTTQEGEQLPYTVTDINLGYDNGTDRLLLRFPQTVTHTVTPESPLHKWASPRGGSSGTAAELVVVVEAVMFCNSANMARTVTYKLPQDVKRDHVFAPMVTRAAGADAQPSMEWQAFHTTISAGQKWTPSAAGGIDLSKGTGSRATAAQRAESAPSDGSGALHAQEVELTVQDGNGAGTSVR